LTKVGCFESTFPPHFVSPPATTLREARTAELRRAGGVAVRVRLELRRAVESESL
jgi:hypothetical protein